MSPQHVVDRIHSALSFGSRLGVFLLLAGGLTLAGCDSSGGGEAGPSTEVSGQATTQESSSGSSSTNAVTYAPTEAGVEGAVVTASSIGANGSTNALAGEATTDANGEFQLTATGQGADGVLRLDADGEGGYSSSVLAWVGGRSSVDAQPMTAETDAESEVYLAAKSEDEASSHAEGVTAADVTVYVDANAAADINAGETPSDEVASAIAAAIEAEAQHNGKAEGGASTSAVADVKADAFHTLQSSLAAASDASARAEAIAAFEDAMANIYVEAGSSEESQAESRQASTSVMIEVSANASSGAAFGLQKQAELLRAEATARAQEAILKAQGASQATIDALVDARQQLTSDIRAAADVQAIVEAKDLYEAEAKAQMEAAFDISSTAIENGEAAIEGSLDALFSNLSEIISSAGLIADGAVDMALSAYGTFYTDAQADAKASFESDTTLSEEKAEAAAEALVYLNVFAEGGA